MFRVGIHDAIEPWVMSNSGQRGREAFVPRTDHNGDSTQLGFQSCSNYPHDQRAPLQLDQKLLRSHPSGQAGSKDDAFDLMDHFQ
jgi:hypothetical protein